MIFTDAVISFGGFMKEEQITKTQRSKPVIAINGWGKERWFPSGREAARQLGLHQSGVTYCLSGQRKKSGGYRFKYAE